MSAPQFNRSLGLVDATMIVAGSMIGSGIFLVSSDMARAVGSPGYLLLLWLITGVITVTGALSYGELAGMMPKAGGQFVYIQKAFGRFTAFLYGWSVFTVIQTGVIAAVAMAFANYTSVFFDGLLTTVFSVGTYSITYKNILAICSIVLLTWFNSKGIKNGKIIQLLFTSAKLFALLALVVLGIAVGYNSDAFQQNFSDLWTTTSTHQLADKSWVITPIAGAALLGAMGATIINSIFSSDAWNNVTFIAAEIKEPQKNIPRSLFLGTFIVTIFYTLANVAYLCLLPLHGNPEAADVMGRGIQFATQDRVGAAAASMIFNNGEYIMAALIMISTFGCNNGLILAGARVYYSMAQEKLFFKKAEELNVNQVPAFALWMQCIWACFLCLTGTYKDLVNFATFASMVFYIVTIAGVFALRKKDPHAERPYKAFGYPVIPFLYIVAAIAICVTLCVYDFRNSGFSLLIIAIGAVVYLFVKKKE